MLVAVMDTAEEAARRRIRPGVAVFNTAARSFNPSRPRAMAAATSASPMPPSALCVIAASAAPTTSLTVPEPTLTEEERRRQVTEAENTGWVDVM